MDQSELFRVGKHDFTSIYETLSHYYPIDKIVLEIKEYPGIIEINELLNENFYNQKRFKEKWGPFKKQLKSTFKKTFREELIAFYPCYSGSIEITQNNFDKYSHIKELRFYISLLGPYYTIYMLDKSVMMLDELEDLNIIKSPFPAFHAITISPYLEYENPFNLTKEIILEYFPGYKFVPHFIYTKKLSGVSEIYPTYQDQKNDKVFSLLFQPELSELSRDLVLRGDTDYGFEEWSTEIKFDLIQIQKKLSIKSASRKEELSIQKVWELKNTIHLPVGLSISFGMEPIVILDLSDEKIADLYVAVNQKPASESYIVEENCIILESTKELMKYKLKDIKLNSLVLIVNFTLPYKGKENSLDFLELHYQVYGIS
jgi:hypothetical protein